MRRFFLRLSNFLRRERADREMAREIASHLALMEDDFIRRGMAPGETRLAARRSYGGVEQTKELQVVLTIVLLFGASIFTHSLRNLKHIDLGYDIDRVLAIHMSARASGNSESPAASAPGLAEALSRVRQLPGVESAGYSFPGVLSEYSTAIGLR